MRPCQLAPSRDVSRDVRRFGPLFPEIMFGEGQLSGAEREMVAAVTAAAQGGLQLRCLECPYPSEA